MIFGSVNLSGNSLQSDTVLQNIGDVLMWDECIQETFFVDAFIGVAFADRKGIFEKEEVFFTDEKLNLTVFLDGFIYNLETLSLKVFNNNQNVVKAPELIANAYLKWGEGFAEHLNGDFAICIYNNKTNQALFFVDQLGIRPLAISVIDSVVYFATDVVGLAKALFNHKSIDRDYLLNIFLRAGHDFMLPPHKSLIRIKPGHYFHFSHEHKGIKRYWFPEKIKTDNSLTEQEVSRDLKQLLFDAVKIRSDHRFNASAHVSGGLDSSIVAALARKAYVSQTLFYGFSWSPAPEKTEEKNLTDERFRIKEICRQNNISPVFTNITLKDYLSFVSEWRHPSELVFEKKIVETAKDKNINLIFSGWGGDEFISITNRGIDADMFKSLNWKHFIKKFPFWRFKRFASSIRMEIMYLIARRNYSRRKAEPVIFPYLKKVLKNNLIPHNQRFSFSSRREVHLQLINLHHIAARTADWYVYGQLNGIEYRYPLLDVRIVEYMLKVPSKYLVNGYTDRKLFRKLGKDIFSDELLKRLSKSDPAKSRAFYSVAQIGIEQFMREFNTFRNNPDLNFINFDKLENDMKRMSATPQKDKPIAADVFFYLKKAHEFTKGFYS